MIIISDYTDEEKAQFKIEYDKILEIEKLKKEYKKKWHPKIPKRKKGLKKGEWKGAKIKCILK